MKICVYMYLCSAHREGMANKNVLWKGHVNGLIRVETKCEIFILHINAHQRASTVEEALNQVDRLTWPVDVS